MSFHYLITNQATKEKTLVEASSPAVAISHVAGEAFEAQRVEGSVLDMLKDSLPIVKAGRAKNETPEPGAQEPAGDPPAGEGDGKSEDGAGEEGDKPPADKGKGAAKP